MISQIFTFGGASEHSRRYVKFEGITKNDCRRQMFAKFGDKWAFQYDTEEDAGVARFKLVLLEC